MRVGILGFTALYFATAACASKPSPVNVSGDPEDRASLAGKWAGEYSSPTSGRSGSIVFNLSPDGDAANGDVVMVPRGYGKPLAPFERGTNAVASPNESQVLTIRFVRVAGGEVTGSLDAYRDPQCDCPVLTSFTGRLIGDRIEGTFTSHGAQTSQTQSGTWRVTRSR